MLRPCQPYRSMIFDCSCTFDRDFCISKSKKPFRSVIISQLAEKYQKKSRKIFDEDVFPFS